MSRQKNGASFARVLRSIAKLGFQYETPLFLFNNVSAIAHGALFGVAVFARQWFFDGVTNAANQTGTLENAIWMLVVFGLVTVSQQALNGVCNFLTTCWFNKFSARMKRVLSRKAARVDPAIYENTELLDRVNKAGEGANHAAGLLFTLVGIFTFYLPYFLVVGAFLYMKKPILALSIVFVFVPVMLTQLIRAKVFTKLEDELAPLRRKYEGYEQAIGDREYFKETRLLGSYGYLKGLFLGALRGFCKKSAKAERKTALWESAMKCLTIVGYMGILYLLFDALMKKEITVGAFAAVFAEVDTLFNLMEEIVVQHIGSVAQDIGSVRNFVEFLDYPERCSDEGAETAVPQDVPSLSLKNVRYRYPGSDVCAVDGVTLSVRPHETLAIVGENGAGKTTLVRLLIGLYLPTEGEAAIDGVSTRDVPMSRLFARTSAVFQKFMRYRMTLYDNVRVSAHENSDGIEPSLRKADLSMSDDSFPDGGDTMLSREFDGVDLSGGQWQRVAIARGFYRAHGLIVLDEPTAAIDPLEETRVYKKFAELSKSVTAIIVTHRMGSARIADRIIVMNKGRIEEEGTHETLMAMNGHYAQMANAQADWYQ